MMRRTMLRTVVCQRGLFFLSRTTSRRRRDHPRRFFSMGIGSVESVEIVGLFPGRIGQDFVGHADGLKLHFGHWRDLAVDTAAFCACGVGRAILVIRTRR